MSYFLKKKKTFKFVDLSFGCFFIILPVGNSMHSYVIDRRADRLWETKVVQGGWVRVTFNRRMVNNLINFVCSGSHLIVESILIMIHAAVSKTC